MELKKRGPGRYKTDFGRIDMYKSYLKSIKGKKEFYNITSKEYSKILDMFNKNISKIIMENSYEFILPRRLGIIRIKKYKQKINLDENGNIINRAFKVDFKSTLDLWSNDEEAKLNKTKVYHLNNHTEGYRCFWYFSNYRCNLTNKSLYKFIPTRANNRNLAKLLKNPNFKGDYYT
jgi:hypothetical protein